MTSYLLACDVGRHSTVPWLTYRPHSWTGYPAI